MATIVLSREPALVRYVVTQTVVITATVRNDAGTLADPSGGVTITSTHPEGVDTAETVAHPSTGVYTATVELDADGRWKFNGQTSGNLIAADKLSVTVEDTGLTGDDADDAVMVVDLNAEEGTHPYKGQTTWHQRRGWIEPDVDLTGVSDATAEIERCGAVRPGVCVYIPHGIVRLNSTLDVPSGCTITGDPRGMRAGDRVFSQAFPVGLRFDIRHTGVGFAMTNQECAVMNAGIYYPDQAVNATPTAYGYTFNVTGIGSYLGNITCVNPYQFISCAANGARFDELYAYPLLSGIYLGRCPDVVRVSNCHFIPITNYEHGATLTAWVQANCSAYIVDGAEAFQFTDCFAYGGGVGIRFVDTDADGFTGSSGSWKGGSLDLFGACVRIDPTHGLSATGLSMSDASMVAVADGNCVLGLDTQVPASDVARPGIHLTDCHGNAAGHGMARFIYLPAGYANVRASGGVVLNVFNEVARNDGTNTSILLRDVSSQSTATRIAGRVTDIGARYVDKPGVTLSENGETNGALLTDANATITVDQGAYRVIPPATLSANRTIDVDNGVAVTDELLTIDRRDAGAFTVTVRDNADATIFTFPVSLPMKATFRKVSGGNFVALGGHRRQF